MQYFLKMFLLTKLNIYQLTAHQSEIRIPEIRSLHMLELTRTRLVVSYVGKYLNYL